jgi:hypothetical protein
MTAVQILILLVLALIMLALYAYHKKLTYSNRSQKRPSSRNQETLPSFEETQYFTPERKPVSFTLKVDPLVSRTTKNGRKFLIFCPDEEGESLVIVSDTKRHHRSLLHNPQAQGLTPLYAYTLHPVQRNLRKDSGLVLPAGKSISPELFKASKDNLRWFTRTILEDGKNEFSSYL